MHPAKVEMSGVDSAAGTVLRCTVCDRVPMTYLETPFVTVSSKRSVADESTGSPTGESTGERPVTPSSSASVFLSSFCKLIFADYCCNICFTISISRDQETV